ncbi:hypothetical protein ACFOWE_05530 [Planomonospora corallina]|uniref:Uncharacterized protein n=1 Tax=Planomonospora corallina TaxID=1806052 RepID=A0ABV8I3V2_9ACTN
MPASEPTDDGPPHAPAAWQEPSAGPWAPDGGPASHDPQAPHDAQAPYGPRDPYDLLAPETPAVPAPVAPPATGSGSPDGPGEQSAPAWQPPPAFTAAAAGIQVWPSPASDTSGVPVWPAATGEPVEELSWPDADEEIRPGQPDVIAPAPGSQENDVTTPESQENTVDTRVPAPGTPDRQESFSAVPAAPDPLESAPAAPGDRPDLHPAPPHGATPVADGTAPVTGATAGADDPVREPHPDPGETGPAAAPAPVAGHPQGAGEPPAPGLPSPQPPAPAPAPAPAASAPPPPPAALPTALPVGPPALPSADQPTPPGGFPVVPPPLPLPPAPSGARPSGPVAERGPFEPPSAVTTEAPAPAAAAPGRGRIILAAAAVAAVVGGIGAGAFFAYRSLSTDEAPPSAAPEVSVPASESPVDIPTEELVDATVLNSELTDPGKMTLAEAFAKKVTVSGTTFTRVKTHLAQECGKAAAGAFATALEDGDCRRVLRATYVDKKKRYAVTTGVAVLPTREAAVKVDQAKDLGKNLWFRALRGTAGTGAERVHIAGGYASGLVWGRYIVFSYATFADGHTPTAKEKGLGRLSGSFRDQTAKVVERRVTR